MESQGRGSWGRVSVNAVRALGGVAILMVVMLVSGWVWPGDSAPLGAAGQPSSNPIKAIAAAGVGGRGKFDGSAIPFPLPRRGARLTPLMWSRMLRLPPPAVLARRLGVVSPVQPQSGSKIAPSGTTAVLAGGLFDGWPSNVSAAPLGFAPQPAGPPPPCTPGSNVVNTSAPTVSGPSTTYEGDTITSSTGTWTSCGNVQPSSYLYQWLRNGSPVSGATSSSYVVQVADIGQTVKSSVMACTDAACSSSYVASSNYIIPRDKPYVPTNLSPPEGGVVQTTTPTFSATFSDPLNESGTVYYVVVTDPGNQVVTSGFGNLVASGSTSSWTITTALSDGQSYCYSAQGENTDGFFSSAAGACFTVDLGVPAPTLSSPGNAATLASVTPVLSASDSDTAPLYWEFQVARDSGFATLLEDSWAPTTNTFTVPPGDLQDGGTAYWRVRVEDGSGLESAWSSTFSFTVQLQKLGLRGYWPIWSHGPLAVNQANGNLVVSVPTPSYPTAVGSLGFSLTYNSQSTTSSPGLGTGWTLVPGDGSMTPPVKLIDHNNYAPIFAAAEIVWPDGSSDYYNQVGGSSAYLPSPANGSQLTKNPDGTWTLVDSDGTIYTFGTESSGISLLTTAQTAATHSGNGLLTYNYLNGEIAGLSFKQTPTSTAETLTFTWNCSNGLLCVTGPDQKTWTYTANGTNEITGVSDSLPRQLMALTYTGGLITKIQNANDLDPSHASPGYNGQHSVQLTYGGNKVACVFDGPISSSSQAATAQPSCAGSSPASESTWSFNYTLTCPALKAPALSTHAVGQGTAVGCTTLTNPRQQPSGPGITVLYDNLGRPLEYDDARLGSGQERISLLQYNNENQLAWSEDPDGNPTDYSYDPLSGVLLTSTGPRPDGINGTQPRPITTHRYDEQTIGTASTAGNPLTGLAGSYWTNTTTLTGQPVARETDPAPGSGQTGFSFSVGSGWPPSAVSGNTSGFSARWSGDITFPSTGHYTFSTTSDGGTRLVIGGIDAIENMSSPTSPASSQTLYLTGGSVLQVKLEYARSTAGTSGANLTLNWSCADCSPIINSQALPIGDLAPAWENQTSVVSPAGRLSFSHYLDPASGQPDYSLVQAVAGVGVFPNLSASGGQGGGAAANCVGGVGGGGGAASSGSSISASYHGGNGGTGYVYCALGADTGGGGGSSAGTGANGNDGLPGSYRTGGDVALGGPAPTGGGAGGGSQWQPGDGGYPGGPPGGGGGASGAATTSTGCASYYTAGAGANGQVIITPNAGTPTTYTSAGTYTVPSGVTSLTVELWGGGGGGGRGYALISNGTTTGASGGGGGGGGAYVKSTSVPVAGGEVLSVTVGAGGAAGANGGGSNCVGSPNGAASPGSPGGASSIQETTAPPTSPPMITSYMYDPLGRLVKKFMPKANTNATTDLTTGNLTSTPDTNYETDYTYYGDGAGATLPSSCGGGSVSNEYGQLQSTTVPNGGLHSITNYYNAAGLPVATVNGAGTTCSTYDNESRLASSQAPGDALPTAYTYDPNGAQLTATGSTASYLGEFGHGTSATSMPTHTVTLTGAPGPGNAVFLRVANTGGVAPGGSAVTDSKGNTWTLLKQGTVGVANSLYATLQNVAPLAAGDVITVAYSPNVAGFAAVVDAFSGISSLSVDQSATASSSSNTTARNTGTTLATTQSSELQIASWGVNAKETSFTATVGASRFTTDFLTNNNATSTEGEYKFVNATGSYNLNASGGVSAKYNGFIVTLPAVATNTVSTYYDEQGRLVDAISKSGTTTSAEARYAYDADSNPICRIANTQALSSTTCPNSTDYGTTYSYDSADELSGETNQRDTARGTYSFFYDNRGNLRGTLYPNGTFSWVDTNPVGEISDQYNRHGSITSTTTTPPADSTPLADYTYTYDPDGKRLSELRKSGSTSQTTTYTYDNLGRLNQVILPSATCRQYSYDLDSNRSQIQNYTTSNCTGTPTTTSYTYNPSTTPGLDELTSIGSTNYAYTGDGQTASQGTTSYTWDGWGRLKTTTIGSNTVTYTYDPTGALKTRTSSNPSTTLNYLLGDLFETNASGTTTTSYIDGPAGNLASYNGPPTSTSTPTYLYYDAHGNLAAEANSSGAITGNHSYDPFGAPGDSPPTNTTAHRFTARWDKQYDTTSGLILMGARPYDPTTGRFLSVDPIPGGSLNNYDYAGQDPINNYDLTGTMSEEDGNFGAGLGGLGETDDVGTGADWLDPAHPEVTFDRDHAAMERHGLSKWKSTPHEIEVKIREDLAKRNFRGVRYTGDWLKVQIRIKGQLFEYRAYRVSPTQVNVGTYFLHK